MTDEEIRNLWRTHDDVIDFARAIEQLVREECAVICDLIDTDCHSEEVIAMTCAEAIRARGIKEK